MITPNAPPGALPEGMGRDLSGRVCLTPEYEAHLRNLNLARLESFAAEKKALSAPRFRRVRP